jgi:hypothetical protein
MNAHERNQLRRDAEREARQLPASVLVRRIKHMSSVINSQRTSGAEPSHEQRVVFLAYFDALKSRKNNA